MKPYKIIKEQKQNLKKPKVMPPLKRHKVPLYFFKAINFSRKSEITIEN